MVDHRRRVAQASWSSMMWLDRTAFTAMTPSAETMCRSMAVR